MTDASHFEHSYDRPTLSIDASDLLAAVAHRPFESGLVPVDPAVTICVTNCWPDNVASSDAMELLKRLVGDDELPEPDASGNLIILARDPLSGGPSITSLRHIYARLRRSDGCPWDREQTELSTVPHISEEAEELREALEREDWRHAAEELGDVLGNVIMISQIASERGAFTFEDVVESISAKLVRRHPHVFGDLTAASADDVLDIWNAVKQQEQNDREETGRDSPRVEASESS